MNTVREAAVAGTFYPRTSDKLSFVVDKLLSDTEPSKNLIPKAIIAPHAGYVYSGAVAASAYAYLQPVANNIKRVILLGPCHRVPVDGLAISSVDFFQTPLGQVPIDKELQQSIMHLPNVKIYDAAHKLEHSLEVHLPFLQSILSNFYLLPIVVGQAEPNIVASVLEKLWGGPETLIVVSSDLSHYLDYKSAQEIDYQTCRAIEEMEPKKIQNQGACGRYPISGLLHVAKLRDLTVETVDLRNSGDTAGLKEKVVGYGAWIFSENILSQKNKRKNKKKDGLLKKNKNTVGLKSLNDKNKFELDTRNLLENHGKTLIHLAAKSILIGLKQGTRAKLKINSFPELLQKNGACFVTLNLSGKLRGCIGSLQMYQPLVADVVNNAFKAAFQDPRFPKLTPSEATEIDISISVLSAHIPFAIRDESDLLEQLRPKKDGLIIKDGQFQALFLPSVWKQLPEPKKFLDHLKTKAGMQEGHWSHEFKAWRFITEEVSSSELNITLKL